MGKCYTCGQSLRQPHFVCGCTSVTAKRLWRERDDARAALREIRTELLPHMKAPPDGRDYTAGMISLMRACEIAEGALDGKTEGEGA